MIDCEKNKTKTKKTKGRKEGGFVRVLIVRVDTVGVDLSLGGNVLELPTVLWVSELGSEGILLLTVGFGQAGLVPELLATVRYVATDWRAWWSWEVHCIRKTLLFFFASSQDHRTSDFVDVVSAIIGSFQI